MSEENKIKNPKGAGRKKKTIDWTVFDTLVSLQCTLRECSDHLGIDEDTIMAIVKREKKETFKEYSSRFTSKLKISLRREIIDLAINQKDKGTLFFLSKQYLGFSDKVEIGGSSDKKPLRIKFVKNAKNKK